MQYLISADMCLLFPEIVKKKLQQHITQAQDAGRKEVLPNPFTYGHFYSEITCYGYPSHAISSDMQAFFKASLPFEFNHM